MVGHTEKTTSWGTGIEQQMIGFLTFALRPWLKRIEGSIWKNLLGPEKARFTAEFAIEGLLRADSASRANLYQSAATNGWMTRAEIRRLENLPFIEGSDELTVQANLTTLEKVGETPEPPPVEPPAPDPGAVKMRADLSAVLEKMQKPLPAPSPTINVHPPTVNVAAPVVHVKMPEGQEPTPYKFERKAVRDEETGLIVSSVDTFTPIKAH
jgi:hypothetical protein